MRVANLQCKEVRRGFLYGGAGEGINQGGGLDRTPSLTKRKKIHTPSVRKSGEDFYMEGLEKELTKEEDWTPSSRTPSLTKRKKIHRWLQA